MRIDSMDVSKPKPIMPNIQTAKSDNGGAVVAQQIQLPMILQIDGKNISQMTEYEKRELPVSEKVVIEAIERANKAIMGANRRFEFSIHEGTKEIMIKVIDADTNEVIREIPPEKILDMVAKMWEMAGIFVDERR